MDVKPATRRSIFAIWRWPRWVWVALVPVMPVGYFFSATPVGFAVHSIFGSNPTAQLAYHTFYHPVGWAYDILPRSFTLRLFDWEMETWGALFYGSEDPELSAPEAERLE